MTPIHERTAKAGRKLGANTQLAIASGVAVVIVLALIVVGIEKDRQEATTRDDLDAYNTAAMHAAIVRAGAGWPVSMHGPLQGVSAVGDTLYVQSTLNPLSYDQSAANDLCWNVAALVNDPATGSPLGIKWVVVAVVINRLAQCPVR